MKFEFGEILKWTGGSPINSEGDSLSFNHIGIDSRKTRREELFIAIQGKRVDGHDYLREAFLKGAQGAIVSKIPDDLRQFSKSGKFVLIKVEDTIKALQEIAANHRRKFKLKVIAVTGSNGKTTTKDLIAHILQSKFSVLKSTGNFNNHLGVPLSLLNLQEKHQIAVLELGMSALGEIKLLSKIAQPQIGIITNVSPVHLEFLDNLENVAQAKAELIEYLNKEGMAVLNSDDPYTARMKKIVKGHRVTFGIKEKSDYQAQEVNFADFSNLSFKINDSLRISLPLLGRHNVYNALAACAVAHRLGLTWGQIKYALADFSGPARRMELKQIAGLNIINDTYNANPYSMEMAIESLLDLRTKGRKILVLGDMLELGKHSSTLHRKLGEKVGGSKIDYLVTVGNFSRMIAQEALHSGMALHRIFHSRSSEEALSVLKKLVQREDFILIKGSRAMKLERILEGMNNAI